MPFIVFRIQLMRDNFTESILYWPRQLHAYTQQQQRERNTERADKVNYMYTMFAQRIVAVRFESHFK